MHQKDKNNDVCTVFMSYAWQTKSIANRIYFDLVRSGLKVWKDDQTTEKGWELWEKISGIIGKCSYFLLLDSVDARMTSHWVQRECAYAKELENSGKLKIAVALVDTYQATHSQKELFENHNEKLYFDFSELKEYDFDGRYKQSITDLCIFFGKDFTRWADIPRAQDFETELSNLKHLDTLNRDLLIKDYEVFQERFNHKFSTGEKRLLNLIEDCKTLGINVVSLYLALGVLQMEKPELDQALSTFTTACQFFEDDPRTFMGLGNVNSHLQNYQAAADAYLKAKELVNRSNNPNHHDHLQDVYRNLFLAYTEASQIDQALPIYEKMDIGRQQLPEVRRAYGKILMGQRKKREAISIFEKLFRERTPDVSEPYIDLAICYKHFEEYEAAIHILNSGIVACSNTYDIKKELAYFYFLMREYAVATSILEELKDSSEEPNLQVYVELATIYFLMIRTHNYTSFTEKREFRKKIKAYCRFAFDYEADNPFDYYLKGQAYYISNKSLKAKEFFETCVKRNNGNTAWKFYDEFIKL
ncbi:TIR domain-containing protein [Flavilitoribacter nigricans]|uniref:TIR domain-containing protein n=1 Tax=Flavilitoribacter nigricans (strain ATCC 23147 / DSM 23189 / NBRC 102662 / NCIMB 1420 / SS-2) TaxID=1122177 RepID=A0A2D0MYR2_FLAN2|nr:TIR domain-containing protein [Flavilitoribacter nigricans]PHN00593.1 hypothetical protein CRP01_41425 [Flavilitoribacter nigricans DSM 23189 = NBRC 102662]